MNPYTKIAISTTEGAIIRAGVRRSQDQRRERPPRGRSLTISPVWLSATRALWRQELLRLRLQRLHGAVDVLGLHELAHDVVHGRGEVGRRRGAVGRARHPLVRLELLHERMRAGVEDAGRHVRTG